jgi:DNA-binding HxlR family transcriptional regulator
MLSTHFNVHNLLKSKGVLKLIHQQECPVETVIHILGGKWKPTIFWHLSTSTKRFSDLEKLLPNASPKMLTQHLRSMEQAGIVERTIYPTIPPKVEYSLSEYGISLIPVAEVMCNWGRQHNERKQKELVSD